jgi:oligoendopeptidase F
VPRYLDLLAAGGSKPPEELAAIVGIDLADPDFWDSGLRLVEAQLTAAEEAAAARS